MLKKLIKFISLTIAGILLISGDVLGGYEAVQINGAVLSGVEIGEIAAGVIFVSEVTDTSFAGILRGTSGKVITVNWGDGNKEDKTLSGTSTDVLIFHNYGKAGNFIISLTGNLEDLTRIKYDNQKLSKFYFPSTLTSLTYLSLSNTSVTGDISSVSNLTSLTYLSLSNTSVTGDISSVSNLTNLTFLSLYSTSVTGDISSLNTLTNLTELDLFNSSVTYTTTIIPDSWQVIYVYDLNWDSATVDQFIIDLDTPGRVADGVLNIAGNNAPRTSASDTALSNLLANGWEVTVNE